MEIISKIFLYKVCYSHVILLCWPLEQYILYTFFMESETIILNCNRYPWFCNIMYHLFVWGEGSCFFKRGCCCMLPTKKKFQTITNQISNSSDKSFNYLVASFSFNMALSVPITHSTPLVMLSFFVTNFCVYVSNCLIQYIFRLVSKNIRKLN